MFSFLYSCSVCVMCSGLLMMMIWCSLCCCIRWWVLIRFWWVVCEVVLIRIILFGIFCLSVQWCVICDLEKCVLLLLQLLVKISSGVYFFWYRFRLWWMCFLNIGDGLVLYVVVFSMMMVLVCVVWLCLLIQMIQVVILSSQVISRMYRCYSQFRMFIWLWWFMLCFMVGC